MPDPTFDPHLFAGIVRRCPDEAVSVGSSHHERDFSSVSAVARDGARICVEIPIALLHGEPQQRRTVIETTPPEEVSR